MKVLVSGATGLIGKELISALLARGDQVIALSRDVLRAQKLFPSAVQVISWEELSLLKELDVVFHLAGENIAQKRWSTRQKTKLRESRIKLTQTLFLKLKNLKSKPLIVAASAIGIYGETYLDVQTEITQVGQGFLSDLCQDWEQAVCQGAQALGSREVRLRLGIVLSSKGGALHKMLPLYQWGLGGKLGDGKQWMSWVHLEDVISCLIFVTQEPKIQGPLNVTSPKAVTQYQFSKLLGQALNRPTFFIIPKAFIKMLLGEMASIVLFSQRVYPEVLIKNGFKFKYEDLEQAFFSFFGTKK